MKFKVEKGTDTYNKLSEVFDKIKDYNNQAMSLANKLGSEEFGISFKGVAGGISCIKYKDKPEGFKVVGKPYQNLFMPKANNKKLWEEINELPILSFDEFNSVIGFEPQFKGLKFYRTYGYTHLNDKFLIDTGDADYTPKDDMIEILESEYKKLSEI